MLLPPPSAELHNFDIPTLSMAFKGVSTFATPKTNRADNLSPSYGVHQVTAIKRKEWLTVWLGL